MPSSLNGTGITFSNGSTQSVAGLTVAVTSLAAGNGIAVSGSTGAVTVSINTPSANTVGSYALAIYYRDGSGGVTLSFGSNYAGGNGYNSFIAGIINDGGGMSFGSTSLSGSWRYMSGTYTLGAFSQMAVLICRVS